MTKRAMTMTIKLKIEGMSCGHCKASVEEALRGVAGVTAVAVDLEGGVASVEGEAEAAALVAAIEERGFDATLL